MYTNTGYLTLTDRELEEINLPLRVNCCGVYRLISRPAVSTLRPEGRPDYQLLYIASGQAFFTLPEGKIKVPAGNMVLYAPRSFQQYAYYLEDQPEVYWVHFTGALAKELLEEAGFSKGSVLHTGISPSYSERFLSIIRELQVPRPCHRELSALYLQELFLLLKRQRKEAGLKKSEMQKEMDELIHFFHENLSSSIHIGECAKALHMSTSWLIRSFRQYTGLSPGQYLTSIRIKKAGELLESTSLRLGEIGAIIGYDNPLYFSRIFKKQTGLSPSEYRKAAKRLPDSSFSFAHDRSFPY